MAEGAVTLGAPGIPRPEFPAQPHQEIPLDPHSGISLSLCSPFLDTEPVFVRARDTPVLDFLRIVSGE